MSELMKRYGDRKDYRDQLLATVSAVVLLTSFGTISNVKASESEDRPSVWIELGGQLSRLEDNQEIIEPPIFSDRPTIFSSSSRFEKPPVYGFEEAGKISFQPEGVDWVLSASVRYGRSASNRRVHQQTYPHAHIMHWSYAGRQFISSWPALGAKFADTRTQISERHLVLDFQAGKDVGLGLFGRTEGTSVVSAGVRFAQFTSKSNIAIKSDPSWHFVYAYFPSYISLFNATNTKVVISQPYRSNWASLHATRSFHGLGPSISWTASLPFAGSGRDGQLTFDWGLNAAALFGRQKTQTHHEATARSGHRGYYPNPITLYQASAGRIRSRSIIVPNIGGFAGLSFRYTDAKISFGYKADFFFGAMDGGIDVRRAENIGFHGPFATISIGLGG